MFLFKHTARVGRDSELARELHKTLRTNGAVTYVCPIADRRAGELYAAGYRLAYCGFAVTLETTQGEYRLCAWIKK